MPSIKLTQLAVDRLQPPASGRIEFFDTQLPSFGLRISATGSRSWIAFYRLHGRLHRMTIGSVTLIPKVDDARQRARDIMLDVERGIDPEAAKHAPPQRTPDTIKNVVEQFIERYAKPKNRSWRTTQALLQRHIIPRWGDRSVDTISKRDVLDLLDELVNGGMSTGANRLLAAIRKMFGWAVERDILRVSPAGNIKAPSKEIERDRVLSDDELTCVWKATQLLGRVPGTFIRILALTGQRRDEVAGMRWVDLNLTNKVWTIPRERTKGDRAHEVPLSPLAVQLITALPQVGTYVFTSKGHRRVPGKAAVEGRLTERDCPISGYSAIKAALDAKIAGLRAAMAADCGVEIKEMPDWRLHDLRRTVGTGIARAGIPVSTISRLLNHKEGGVTRIYNRYSYIEEKRAALDLWAEHLARLVGEQVIGSDRADRP